MGINLKKISDRLTKLKNGGKDATFLKLKLDTNVEVRLLPSPDDDPFKDYWFHYKVGREPGFLCPRKNFGEDCPVCDFATELYQSGTKEQIAENVKLAKDLFAKQRFFSAVVVRGEEDQGVRVWSYGKTSYETLLKLIVNPDYGDITDLDEGTDLTLGYTKPEKKTYPETSITPKRKTSSLCGTLGDEKCKELLDSIPDYDDIFERKTTAEVQSALDTYLAGSTDKEAEEGSTETTKYGEEKAPAAGTSVDEAFAELQKGPNVSGSSES